MLKLLRRNVIHHSRPEHIMRSRPGKNILKSLILLACFSLTAYSGAFAQSSYHATGPTPGNLLRTATDATTSGASLVLAYNDGGGASSNVWSAANTLPFAFNFYGSPVTSYVVNKNGLLSFDATLAGTASPATLDVNTALPNTNLPANTIAYFWGDFSAPISSGDNIYEVTYGTAPNRQHWIFNYSYKIDALSFGYFAVVLEETTNNIYMVDMYNVSATGTFTVGVQTNATTAVQLPGSPNISMLNTGSGNNDNDYYTFEPFVLSPTEVGVSAILAPANGCGKTTTEPVTVTISNYGTAPQSNFPVTFQVAGPTNTALVTETVTTTIPAGGTLNYTFTGTANLAAIGNYTITAATNLTGDADPTNDASSQTVSSYNPLAGTYTINAGSATAGTNFISFSDAIKALNTCGVTGAVTLNVTASSGPYTEQIELMEIPGASATNTITINGNGNTLQANTTDVAPAVITLNGTDYLTINNLTIATTGTSTTDYGWGIHFLNGANNNSISSSTINIGTTSTNSNFSGGIIFSNSTANATTTGNTGINNVISGNTITGGYRGIKLNSDITLAGNNQITGNTIQDFFSTGLDINNANGTLIESNDISRPTRPTVTTFQGILLTGSTQNSIINKNRLHNTHGGATSLTGSAYGFYSTGNDAPVGSENIFKNNLIYDFNNTGTQYGTYNSSSDGAFYYNNTFDLSNPNNTGIVRGIFQTTTASNIKVINNIVSVNAGTTGSKNALYFATTASDIISNYNVLYIDTLLANQYIGYYSGNKSTLADWQAANATTPYDLNSVAADPQFTNPAAGNLQPVAFSINNIGTPLTAVADDFLGTVRNPVTPDPGAYEFSPPANNVGIVSFVSPVSSTCGASTQETVSIVIQNYGSTPVSNFPVTYSINGAPFIANETVAGPIAPGTNITYDFVTKANLSAGGTFSIKAKTLLTGDAIAVNDTLTEIVTILSPISTFPYLQDFETFTSATNATGFMDGWEVSPSNTTSLYRWNVDESTTPSSSTGPTVDHTMGTATGKYVFTEASSGASGNIAELTSRCISLPAGTPMNLEFWYHMYGVNMGTLHVDINNGTTWITDVLVYNGQQQTSSTDAWRKGAVSLASYSGNSIKIRFRGERGGSFEGDMAIDDIKIFALPPVELEASNLTLPTNSCGLSTVETICMDIINNGANAISNFPVKYSVNGGTLVSETVTSTINPGDTLQYCFTTKANFSTAGVYNITAIVSATGDASTANDTITGTLVSKPLISTFPYTEGFENGPGNWTDEGTNSTWALGTPTGTIINSAGAGLNSWVTNLSGLYNNDEQSAVVSPCFNFTGVANPTISMKIWWTSENSFDGTVLQSSIDGGATWQNVGAYQDPNNWYNDNTINSGPGGQSGTTAQGWTGTNTNSSGGWVTASHALTGLGGLPSVQLRVAFSSDGSITSEGFAFDDITIFNQVTIPTITAGGPTTFCQGDSVVLTAASTIPGATFTWELNGTAIPGATSSTYTATASGSYTAVTTIGGTATSTPIVVTVNPLPATPTITAGSATTFCAGDSVVLTGASTTAGVTYQWYLNGTMISGATTATLTANASGNYMIVASNASGCSDSSIVTTVTANALPATPTITAGGATTFCSGDSVILTGASTTAGVTYQWYLNGTLISGATADSISANASGNYMVVVSNASGCSDTSLVTAITVTPLPATPTITQSGQELTSSAATGNQWYLNGTAIPGATNQTYTTSANGNYTVIVTDNGCASDTSAGVNITNTGISKALTGMSVNVYPNPNNGNFNVKLSGYKQAAALELYSLTGQLIVKKGVKAGQEITPIQVDNLAAGTYLLKVISDKGVQIHKLIVE